MLESLPPEEYQSGLGELAKYAFLGAEGLADLPLAERVARCVEIKAAVVAADEQEAGQRAVLNYGHTLAHALETHASDIGADLRHGEAVAIGLVFAALLARRLGRIDDERVEDHRRVVTRYGLPAELPAGADASRLIDLMARDKKATTGLTFVLDGVRGVEVVRGVERSDVRAALADMDTVGEEAR